MNRIKNRVNGKMDFMLRDENGDGQIVEAPLSISREGEDMVLTSRGSSLRIPYDLCNDIDKAIGAFIMASGALRDAKMEIQY